MGTSADNRWIDALPVHAAPSIVTAMVPTDPADSGALPAGGPVARQEGDGTPTLDQMVTRILAAGAKSGAEALKELRASFPETPLMLRVAALNRLLRGPLAGGSAG